MAWSFNIMVLCRAIELKLSEPTLAQDPLVSRSIYIKCSNSARFFSSRSRVKSKNDSISSFSRASNFSCSPSRAPGGRFSPAWAEISAGGPRPNPTCWGVPGAPGRVVMVLSSRGPAESARRALRRPHRLGSRGNQCQGCRAAAAGQPCH